MTTVFLVINNTTRVNISLPTRVQLKHAFSLVTWFHQIDERCEYFIATCTIRTRMIRKNQQPLNYIKHSGKE